jgi:hypothetical protein
MTYLPQNTLLGKLELVEVYEYHDKPVLFACRNASYTHYLVVQEGVHARFETWLYASLSYTRFQQVRTGLIDLHDAFSDAEDGFVFLVTLFDDASHVPQVTTIPISHLDDAQIPDAGEFLNLESAGLAKIIP